MNAKQHRPQSTSSSSDSPRECAPRAGYTSRAEQKRLFIIFLDIWLLIERITRSPLPLLPRLPGNPTWIPRSCQLARLLLGLQFDCHNLFRPAVLWLTAFFLPLPQPPSLYLLLSPSLNWSNRSAIKFDCLLGLWQTLSVVFVSEGCGSFYWKS